MKNTTQIKTKAIGMTALAVAMLVSLAPMAMAQPTGHGPGGRGQRLADFLGLSDEQKATWQSLRDEHKSEMAPLRQEGQALHQQLRTAMNAATPDPTTVGSATLAMKQHREKVRAAETAFFGRLEGVLNDEQKTKLEAFKAAHGHGGRRGFGGGWGPGGDRSEKAPAAIQG